MCVWDTWKARVVCLVVVLHKEMKSIIMLYFVSQTYIENSQ